VRQAGLDVVASLADHVEQLPRFMLAAASRASRSEAAAGCATTHSRRHRQDRAKQDQPLSRIRPSWAVLATSRPCRSKDAPERETGATPSSTG